MASMKQVEEKVFFSSVLTSTLCPKCQKLRTRRRRKKVRADERSGAESKKRKLNDDHMKFLEINFGNERKQARVREEDALAPELGLDPKQVAVWFQNRRARWKNKQLEEEYMKLKFVHDATVVQKCHLENEVLSLKKRLLEAKEKIKSLSRSGGGGDEGGSPSSSSTETYQPLAGLGEFGVEDDLMYMNEYNYIMEYGYEGLFGM